MGRRPTFSLICSASLLIAATGADAGPLTGAVGIGAAQNSSCAMLSTGTKCWGFPLPPPGPATPTDLPGISGSILQYKGYNLQRCVLTSSGGVKCWGGAGNNQYGELGDGTAIERFGPTDVLGITSGAIGISVGQNFACAAMATGGVKCWGFNGLGYLGTGQGALLQSSPAPLDTTIGSGATEEISTGYGHTCAVTTTHVVKCWGDNYGGKAGLYFLTSVTSIPTDVASLAAVAVAASFDDSCAVTTDGGVKCWGADAWRWSGKASNDSLTAHIPAQVLGLESDVASIAAGSNHFCVVMASGAVKCWGANDYGQLGDGSTTTRAMPVDVVGLSNGVAAVTAGYGHTCALMTSGAVRCWGRGASGQLGNGTYADFSVPVTVGTFETQTVTFPPMPAQDVNLGSLTPPATATSGLPVSFAVPSTTSVCNASGSVVNLISIGICTVVANQLGDTTYSAAPSVTRSFLVNGQTPAMGVRLGNISTRMQAFTGNDALIAGFAVKGPLPKTVVIRARGPSLATSGVTGSLADPYMDIDRGIYNDWANDPRAANLPDIGFAPTSPKEAAVALKLQPGLHTVIVQPQPGTTAGVGLVEVFEIDTPDSPLINISTRGKVGLGNDAMIAGFIIHGTTSKTVVVRARGPSLSALGVAGVLADPSLQLVRSSDQAIIATNDDWQSAPNSAQVLASGYQPLDAKESAVLMTLDPGAYTAVVTGVGGSTGVGLVEVFALD